MHLQGDYIDGGSGDDCIILEGHGERIVLGGPGNDKAISVPAGTSEATIQDIFAHCGDSAYLTAQYGGAPATPAQVPVRQAVSTETPAPGQTPVQRHTPAGHMTVDMSADVVAIILGVLLALAVVARRFTR